MRKEKFKALWIFALLFLFLLFFIHWSEGKKLKAEIAAEENALRLNQQEIDRLNDELSARYADDCKVERTWYGFRCTEFKTGKVFKVFM